MYFVCCGVDGSLVQVAPQLVTKCCTEYDPEPTASHGSERQWASHLSWVPVVSTVPDSSKLASYIGEKALFKRVAVASSIPDISRGLMVRRFTDPPGPACASQFASLNEAQRDDAQESGNYSGPGGGGTVTTLIAARLGVQLKSSEEP
jgi:hypothetical protein